jgi:hypothetical protein
MARVPRPRVIGAASVSVEALVRLVADANLHVAKASAVVQLVAMTTPAKSKEIAYQMKVETIYGNF